MPLRTLVVPVSYAAVIGVVAAPWIGAAAHAIPAHQSELLALHDAKLLVWILAWGAHALAREPGHFFDANIFHPTPGQLTGSDACLSSQLVAAPVFWATDNAVLTANVVVLLSYPLGAWAMERLARRLGCSALAAWLAGLVFALGPLRVPGNLQVLQYLNLYLPLAALALEGLRDTPGLRAGLVLALVVALGAASSLYMAVMLAVALVVWTTSLVLGGGSGRGRFCAGVGLATAAGYGLVAALLRPYFERADAADVARNTGAAMRGLHEMHRAIVAAHGPGLVGAIPLGLAALGVAAIVSSAPGPRAAARRGLALVVVGVLFMLGPMQPIGDVEVPLPFALLGLSSHGPLRFPWRFAVLAGFGTALLTAAAATLLEKRAGRRLGGALVAGAAVLVLATRGAALVATPLEAVPAITTDRPVYEAVRDAARDADGGALLELPVARGAVSDAAVTNHMIASTIHWLPLVAGYTGYPPPYRDGLFATIARLPDPVAIDQLAALSRLRWILVEPADRWEALRDRETLLASPRLCTALARDGWVLRRLVRSPDEAGPGGACRPAPSMPPT